LKDEENKKGMTFL